MTETVLYIGGNAEMEGKVLSREGAVLTVELADGSVVRRHEANFKTVEVDYLETMSPEQIAAFDKMIDAIPLAPRKHGRPKKHV